MVAGMSIDFQSLEKAFSRIESVVREEVYVEIDGVRVVLRPLNGEEEIKVLEQAVQTLQERTRSSRVATVDFFYRIQISTLAYAIVQIGDLSLREDEVMTGEVLENGVPVTREKADVVRELISTHWSKTLVVKMFLKVESALQALASKTAERITIEPFDVDAEILRLEGRLEELRKSKENKNAAMADWGEAVRNAATAHANGAPDYEFTDIVTEGALSLSEIGEEPSQEETEPLPATPPPPSGRKSSIPTEVAPPPQTSAPIPSQHFEPKSASEIRAEESEEDHTWVDEGNFEDSVRAETERQIRIRNQVEAQKAAQAGGKSDPRLNSLRQAANTTNMVVDASKSRYQDVPPQSTRWGNKIPSDLEVSRGQGAVELSEHSRKVRVEDVVINQGPAGSRNPRYRGR